MTQGIDVVGVYVRDQDEALAFYVEKLGFRVHTDVRNGDYRWLTVQHPEQPSFQLGLFKPGPPVHDAATAQALHEVVAKGAMPPLVLVVNNRVAEQIKNYADVAEQARQEALQQKRSRVAQEWVAGLRKLAKVENKLAEVLKTFEPPKTEEKKDQPAGKITPPDPTTKPGTPKP